MFSECSAGATESGSGYLLMSGAVPSGGQSFWPRLVWSVSPPLGCLSWRPSLRRRFAVQYLPASGIVSLAGCMPGPCD
jgi:hypothetical protein